MKKEFTYIQVLFIVFASSIVGVSTNETVHSYMNKHQKIELKSPKWQTATEGLQVDMNSLKINGDTREGYQKVKVADGGTVVGYFVDDCSKSRYQMLSGIKYDKDGKSIGDYDHMSMRDSYLGMKSEWKTIPPGTQGYAVLKFVCGK